MAGWCALDAEWNKWITSVGLLCVPPPLLSGLDNVFCDFFGPYKLGYQHRIGTLVPSYFGIVAKAFLWDSVIWIIMRRYIRLIEYGVCSLGVVWKRHFKNRNRFHTLSFASKCGHLRRMVWALVLANLLRQQIVSSSAMLPPSRLHTWTPLGLTMAYSLSNSCLSWIVVLRDARRRSADVPDFSLNRMSVSDTCVMGFGILQTNKRHFL